MTVGTKQTWEQILHSEYSVAEFEQSTVANWVKEIGFLPTTCSTSGDITDALHDF